MTAIAVYPSVWRWETPDPQDDFLMVGHFLTAPTGVVLVDPPVVPGILATLQSWGPILAVVLTTHDHVRGAQWFQNASGAPVYLPRPAWEDPVRRGRLSATPYGDGDQLPGGLAAHRIRVATVMWGDEASAYVDEMALTTPDGGALLTGDVAMGGPAGQVWPCPQGLVPQPDPRKVAASRAALQALLAQHPSVHTLLAPHGHDVLGSLREAALT